MSNPFRCFNSSPEIIRLVVLMYVKYTLSLRNVEDLLAERSAMRRSGFGGTNSARCLPLRSEKGGWRTCAGILSGGVIWMRRS